MDTIPSGQEMEKGLSVPQVLLIVVFFIAVVAAFALLRPASRNFRVGLFQQGTVNDTSPSMTLTVNEPSGKAKLVNGEMVVSGWTLPNTAVAVYGDNDDSIVRSDKDGNFAASLFVGYTYSVFGISAVTETGARETQYFKISGLPDAAPVQPSSVSATLAEFLTGRPVANPVLKMGLTRIKQAIDYTGTDSAKYGRVVSVKTEMVKETVPGHVVLSGVISKLGEQYITLVDQPQSDARFTVYYNSGTQITHDNTVLTSADSLKFGSRVVAVGISSKEGLLATRIYVLPGTFKVVVTPTPSAPAQASPSAH